MRKVIQIVAVSSAVVAASGIALGWLWWQQAIELPAVAVRGLGRVAGLMSVEGTMDVQLPISFHRQEHSLSCEIATLKMALDSYGITIPEASLIDQLPFDRTPKGGGVWGDPNEGFVGSIDGKMLVTGYGVYWDPIAKVGQRYRRTEVLRNSTAAEVAGHIAAGRPVIVWGYYGRYKPYSWTAANGKAVQAVNGEHVRIVTGFNGSAQAPTQFSLIDPIFGPITWSTNKFMENWTSLGRHAVVVYPHPRWVRVVGSNRIWEISKDGTTRQAVLSWDAFVARGGFDEAVLSIDNATLLEYKLGDAIAS